MCFVCSMCGVCVWRVLYDVCVTYSMCGVDVAYYVIMGVVYVIGIVFDVCIDLCMCVMYVVCD